MKDQTMADAIFLHAHPSWSQHDLMEADQDIITLLSAIHHEDAMQSRRLSQQQQRESRAAAHDARLGRH